MAPPQDAQERSLAWERPKGGGPWTGLSPNVHGPNAPPAAQHAPCTCCYMYLTTLRAHQYIRTHFAYYFWRSRRSGGASGHVRPSRRALLARMRAPIKWSKMPRAAAGGGALFSDEVGQDTDRSAWRRAEWSHRWAWHGCHALSPASQDPAPALWPGDLSGLLLWKPRCQDAQVRPGEASRRLLRACAHGVDTSSCRWAGVAPPVGLARGADV